MVLFTRLFGLDETLIDVVISLVGKLVHMIETFVHAPDEFPELPGPHKLTFRHDSALSYRMNESCQPA